MDKIYAMLIFIQENACLLKLPEVQAYLKDA